MLFPVPQTFDGDRSGVAPALIQALEGLFGQRGDRWDVVAYFAPTPSYEIDIPSLADAATFNAAFPNFASGSLASA